MIADAKGSLPKGTFVIVELDTLTATDTEYLGGWLAKSFSKSDAFAYLVTGKAVRDTSTHISWSCLRVPPLQYQEDPVAHELFQKAMLDRQTATGTAVTNETRTAFRMMFKPGQQDRSIDFDWESPKDENWNLMLERCGGKEVVRSRCKAFQEACGETFKALYGEDKGLSLYRSNTFAVRSDVQGQGVGRVLHKYMADKAKAEGKTWFFLSVERNVPAYLRFGCKVVGDKLATTVPPEGLAHYPPGNEYFRVIEA